MLSGVSVTFFFFYISAFAAWCASIVLERVHAFAFLFCGLHRERPTRHFLDKDITCGSVKSGAERRGLTLINPRRDLTPVPRRACLKQTTAEAINLRASM